MVIAALSQCSQEEPNYATEEQTYEKEEPTYTKIANDGSELPDSTQLGTGAKDWACTKDGKTGLIWEVKTTDGGLRDMTKTYTNYTENYPNRDCRASFERNCEESNSGKLGDSTNADGFVKATNETGLCGAKDWRLPTIEELKGLVYCDNSIYIRQDDTEGKICDHPPVPATGETMTTINTTYFPNTLDGRDSSYFWSSSSSLHYSSAAASVDFYVGFAIKKDKHHHARIRLVRQRQETMPPK